MDNSKNVIRVDFSSIQLNHSVEGIWRCTCLALQDTHAHGAGCRHTEDHPVIHSHPTSTQNALTAAAGAWIYEPPKRGHCCLAIACKPENFKRDVKILAWLELWIGFWPRRRWWEIEIWVDLSLPVHH